MSQSCKRRILLNCVNVTNGLNHHIIDIHLMACLDPQTFFFFCFFVIVFIHKPSHPFYFHYFVSRNSNQPNFLFVCICFSCCFFLWWVIFIYNTHYSNKLLARKDHWRVKKLHFVVVSARPHFQTKQRQNYWTAQHYEIKWKRIASNSMQIIQINLCVNPSRINSRAMITIKLI